jgi:hypothetical protein
VGRPDAPETREPGSLGGREAPVPLTPYQRSVLAVIGAARTPESYLAGGTALHFSPQSTRYSHDLDIFHDSLPRVAEAFETDHSSLRAEGFEVEVLFSQPGFIRAVVRRDDEATQIDWAHDSSWRFMPVLQDEVGGFLLHPIDLATNKVLALAGREEPRDFVDVLFVIDRILDLGPLVWAAVAKDPGFTPLSLLEQLKRRGRVTAAELSVLDLVSRLDPVAMKETWLAALDRAEDFVGTRPSGELGCLYFSTERNRFEAPEPERPLEEQGLVPHYGRPGGVLPRPADQRLDSGGTANGEVL